MQDKIQRAFALTTKHNGPTGKRTSAKLLKWKKYLIYVKTCFPFVTMDNDSSELEMLQFFEGVPASKEQALQVKPRCLQST